MHELAITKHILDILTKESQERNIPITKATVEIGILTTYKADPITYYFDLQKKDNIKNTVLTINTINGKLKCNNCKEESVITEPTMTCPKCQSTNTTITKGKDIIIKTIEVDDGN
jgi:hydrogenase nickel incorporation protein HypA/HybF